MRETKKGPRAGGHSQYMGAFSKFHGNYTGKPAHRKLPPYGAKLRDIAADPVARRRCVGSSADGELLTIWLICGADGWTLARSWSDREEIRAFILLPLGDDPAAYDWRLLRGNDPILLHFCGEIDCEQTKALILALMRDGVQRVLAPNGLRYVAEVDYAISA
jgi:hypothetical protein